LLNWVIIVLIAGGTLTAAFTGTMEAATKAGIDSAKTAVQLAIGLIGQMAVWLGMMRILQDAGLLNTISRKMMRVMGPLFPGIPSGHPAMAAMVMNVAANMLGLANAATPFGLKAMKQLDKLNKNKGVATDAMALFLAINTSGVAVMPLGVVAVRGMMDCADPAGIFVPSMIATACSTLVAILVAKTASKLPIFAVKPLESVELELRTEEEEGDDAIKGLDEAEAIAAESKAVVGWRRFVMPLFCSAMLAAVVLHVMNAPEQETGFETFRTILGQWILPSLMALIVLFGLSRQVRVYESFVKGAKEGFDIAIMIIPFLVAILVAIGVFRASGGLDAITSVLASPLRALGFPIEALPMALIRPLSGSGALTVLMDTLKTHGKDSFVGFVVSVMNGSTETTFYVLALYFGSIQVRRARHTVIACLAADCTGIIAAVVVSTLWLSA
jgi:spore maturation protein SpmA